MAEQRVQTGAEGLDGMLRGGFLPGTVLLIRGAPGTGKTSLAFQYLVAGARRGERGLFVTFEEFPESLYRDAAALGFDLRELEAAGTLRILFTSPAVLLSQLQAMDSSLYPATADGDVQRAVIDSMTHFTRMTSDPYQLRHIHTTVVNSLRREGITTLLLSEEARSDLQRTDPGGLAYLSDGIILLRYVEVESAIQRALVVLKLRGSDHAREIRHYRIQEGGLVIGDIFEHRGAILSGISRRD